MTTFAELDKLSTADLHHRAVSIAEHHADVKFFWRLLEYIPVAEAAAGDVGESDYDIQKASGLLNDYIHRGGQLDEALRPIYIDYLEHHGQTPKESRDG